MSSNAIYKAVRTSKRLSASKFSSSSELNKHEKKQKAYSDMHKKGVQLLATRTLLKLRAANNGKARRGDIKKVIKEFHEDGHYFITKGTMNYSILKDRQKAKKNLPRTVALNDGTEVSPLSDTPVDHVLRNAALASSIPLSVQPEDELKQSGRKKGSTVAAKEERISIFENAKNEAALLCLDETLLARDAKRNIPTNRVTEIINATEEKYGLDKGTIKVETIRSRIKRNNITAFKHQETSPLAEIEPHLVNFCLQICDMGFPLTRDQVILLAESLIKDTEYYDKMYAYKKKLKLPLPKDKSVDGLIGRRW